MGSDVIWTTPPRSRSMTGGIGTVASYGPHPKRSKSGQGQSQVMVKVKVRSRANLGHKVNDSHDIRQDSIRSRVNKGHKRLRARHIQSSLRSNTVKK